MEKIFIEVFHLSISASYLILAVILTRLLLRKVPKNMICFLWLLVGIRLVVPFSVESGFSLIPSKGVVNEQILNEKQPSALAGVLAGVLSANNFPYESRNAEVQVSGNQISNLLYLSTYLWITGIILMFGYFCISYYRITKRVRMAVPQLVDDGKVYRCGEISSPFLLGMIYPRIYIPEGISDRELPFVIQHERAHMRRKDYLLKPAFYLILSIYWFQPLVWAAYLLFCKDIELACDERVVRELGFECRKEYSQVLLNCSINRRHIIACPLAFGEVEVKQRIRNILNYKKPSFWGVLAVLAVSSVISVCFMTQKKSEANDTETSLQTTFAMSDFKPIVGSKDEIYPLFVEKTEIEKELLKLDKEIEDLVLKGQEEKVSQFVSKKEEIEVKIYEISRQIEEILSAREDKDGTWIPQDVSKSDTGDINIWFNSSIFTDENDFWRAVCGISE